MLESTPSSGEGYYFQQLKQLIPLGNNSPQRRGIYNEVIYHLQRSDLLSLISYLFNPSPGMEDNEHMSMVLYWNKNTLRYKNIK